MSDVTQSLIAKLEAAGLTDEERVVLAVAMGAPHDRAEVEGFVASQDELVSFNIGMPPGTNLGNFEIQDFRTRFDQAGKLARTFKL